MIQIFSCVLSAFRHSFNNPVLLGSSSGLQLLMNIEQYEQIGGLSPDAGVKVCMSLPNKHGLYFITHTNVYITRR